MINKIGSPNLGKETLNRDHEAPKKIDTRQFKDYMTM